MKKGKKHIGIDQYGQVYRLGKYPRKELLDRLDYSKASKMYQDTISGGHVHIGYVIGPFWISLYQIKPFKEEKE